MDSNLFSIRLRETNDIDFGEELRNIIKKDYFQAPSLFETDLIYITNLRRSISKLVNTGGESTHQFQQNESKLKEYYFQLDCLTKKFPDDSIEFTWCGTLGHTKGRPIAIRSIYFEKMNIIYQLGALYSNVALTQSRSTDEGLKEACSYFQKAAGAFTLLLEMIKEYQGKANHHYKILPEIDVNTLSCLKSLFMAQAQEMFWQKALGNNKLKDSVIARLSIQTSDYYLDAFKYGNSSEYITLNLINHTAVKLYHFKAASNLRMSIVSLDNFEYGNQVAYLRVAKNSCYTAFKYKNYVSQSVIEDLYGLSKTIEDTLRVAEKDNNLVYLKPEPNESDLKRIQAASMINDTQLDVSKFGTYRAIFRDLLPFIIPQTAQAFKLRREEYLKENIFQPIENANNRVTKFLGDRNLPTAIDAIQSPENLPDSIIQHSQEIISYGATEIIEASLTEISKLAKKCYEILGGCKNRIEIEANEDNIMRSRYDRLWIRPVSAIAGKDLIYKLTKMETYLEEAKSGDEVILQKYTEAKPFIELYAGGYDKLIQYIPSSTYIELEPLLREDINNLRSEVNEILGLVKRRRSLVSEVEIQSRKLDFFPLVMEEYQKNHNILYDEKGNVKLNCFQHIYDENISSFDRYIKSFEELYCQQVIFEQNIDILNTTFISNFENKNEGVSQRQEILSNLESAYLSYLELISNMNEGSNFYGEFIFKSNAVLQECEEYLEERRLEARDLEIKLSQEIQYSNDKNQNMDIRIACPQSKSGIWQPGLDIKFS